MEFINECNCIFENEVLECSIIEECKRRKIKPKSQYKIYNYRGYAGISLKHDKVSIHRIIGKYMVGMDFDKKICVHHINHNKLDNRISNLQVMKNSLHTKEHYIFQYVSKKQLDENRKKAVEKRKRNDVTTLQVLELRQQGKTYGEIAKELKCGENTVWRRLSKINQNRLE